MRAAVRLAVPLALACLAATPALAQPRPGAKATDWSLVQRQYNASVLRQHNELLEGWIAAWVKGDARDTGRNYTEDAVVLFTNGVHGEKVQSRPAVERWLPARLQEYSDVRVALSDFQASGGMAYAYGTYFLQKRAAAGSDPEVVTGSYVAVIVEDRGRWKFQSQVFVPDAPAAATAAAPAPAAPAAGGASRDTSAASPSPTGNE